MIGYVTDPSDNAEARLRAAIDNAQPALAKLAPASVTESSRLTFTDDLNAAVADADFIQESVPERMDLKRKLLQRVSRLARPDVVIASSS